MLSKNRAQNWKSRFEVSNIPYSTVAKKDQNRGLLFSNQSGLTQWYSWDRVSDSLTPLTSTPGGHSNFAYLSPLGDAAYTLQDDAGNEIGHYVRYEIGAEAESAPVDISPELPPYASFGFSMSDSGRRLGFIAVYDDLFHIYVADIDADGTLSPVRLVTKRPETMTGMRLSADGKIIYVNLNLRRAALNFSLLALDAESGEALRLLDDGEGVNLGIVMTSPTDASVLAKTSKTGVDTLFLWDPLTGNRRDLQFEGAIGTIRALDWSADGKTLLGYALHQAQQSIFKHNLETGETMMLPSLSGIVGRAYFLGADQDIVMHHESSTRSMRMLVVDGHDGRIKQTLFEPEEIAPGIAWRSIEYASTDGTMIQAWLALPSGAGDGPFPTILKTHGGPTAVQTDVYAPDAQTWLEHGYAFLSINYRGSITFGKPFQDQILGNLGYWEVEDMVAARAWLVEEGIARPDAVFLEGRSYGGYLTLQAMGLYPGLWAGGMGTVAIADWSIQFEDTADTLRSYQISLLGGTPADVPEVYRKSSPITYVDQVDAPVLIIQGRQDTRTPARPIEMYEARMRELGKEIEVYWYDTGHAGAYASVEEAIKHMALRLDFAAKVLDRLA